MEAVINGEPPALQLVFAGRHTLMGDEKIMEAASKHHADLIVMGAKGLGAIDRFLLGSVSTRVVQHAHCPVLVVR